MGAWRALTTLELKVSGKHVEIIREYRDKIEKEFEDACKQILQILVDQLLPTAVETESKVFYLKMKGDYYRYLAEFSTGDDHRKSAEDAHDAYRAASSIAMNDLAETNPIRLGLALNFSVFYYEVLNSPDRACLLAKAAFDEAISVMDNLDEERIANSQLRSQWCSQPSARLCCCLCVVCEARVAIRRTNYRGGRAAIRFFNVSTPP